MNFLKTIVITLGILIVFVLGGIIYMMVTKGSMKTAQDLTLEIPSNCSHPQVSLQGDEVLLQCSSSSGTHILIYCRKTGKEKQHLHLKSKLPL